MLTRVVHGCSVRCPPRIWGRGISAEDSGRYTISAIHSKDQL